ncbi:WD40-repeat-containing domain protein [Zychaea mexicana]|uniref:WD40-repeat-containing domain protein n=1 Tax=Zychaea mexicana TaxID=64656 RepID=UPI0022FED488|nr:WD40-repeat-containing domain protein [Zychaea mexicana]KAI9489693.1 WD40-repeat-containing domain protein [Zychaea mexicana]
MTTIAPLISRDLTFTPYSIQWIPTSVRICAVGATGRGTGSIAVYELQNKMLTLVGETETTTPVRCCTMGAADGLTRRLATGDFDGQLQIWCVLRFDLPLSTTKAHETIINAIDGCGGATRPGGARELATVSRDGSVKVWDTRDLEKSVLVIKPKPAEQMNDAWAVAFGNFENGNERLLAVGFDNGDFQLFDISTTHYIYKTNVKSGICAIDFSGPTQLTLSTLTGIVVIDFSKELRATKLPVYANTTVWSTRQLPQSPNYFAAAAGDGTVSLWSYDNLKKTSSVLSASKHPIISSDWSRDKKGLLAYCSFDQTLRVGFAKGV